MPIIHTNVRGDHYYLHVGTTPKGKPKYFFSKSDAGDLADTIPDGFEIYEDADARVTLRRILSVLITDLELIVVDRHLKSLDSLSRYHLDRKGTFLTVSTAEKQDGGDFLGRMFGGAFPFNAVRAGMEAQIARSARLTPIMRFELVDEEKRLFQTYRFCFRGSIDDWIPIGGFAPIGKVAREFIPHIGKESFYKLM